jgi:hypothetical protein
MTNERATLTVNSAEAQRLRCRCNKRPHDIGMIYDPRSGVNIRKTAAGESITVPRGKDYSRLIAMQAEGLFTVATGKLESTAATVTGITIDADDKLVIAFSTKVWLSAEITPANLVALLDGETPITLSATAIPAETANTYTLTKTFDIITGDISAVETISAALGTALTKFKDENDVACAINSVPLTITHAIA